MRGFAICSGCFAPPGRLWQCAAFSSCSLRDSVECSALQRTWCRGTRDSSRVVPTPEKVKDRGKAIVTANRPSGGSGAGRGGGGGGARVRLNEEPGCGDDGASIPPAPFASCTAMRSGPHFRGDGQHQIPPTSSSGGAPFGEGGSTWHTRDCDSRTHGGKSPGASGGESGDHSRRIAALEAVVKDAEQRKEEAAVTTGELLERITNAEEVAAHCQRKGGGQSAPRPTADDNARTAASSGHAGFGTQARGGHSGPTHGRSRGSGEQASAAACGKGRAVQSGGEPDDTGLGNQQTRGG